MKLARRGANDDHILNIDFAKIGGLQNEYFDEPSPYLLPKIRGTATKMEAKIVPLMQKRNSDS